MQLKKRLTISLDEKLVWYLRNIQTDWTLEKNQNVSISNVVSTLLYKAVKNEKIVDLKLDSIFARNNLA